MIGRRPMILIAAGLILSVASDFAFLSGATHGTFWWSRLPGFFAFFGFLACVALITISKMLGGHWLQRREGYYKKRHERDA
ncbi:MAG: hypothetical protein ACE5HC_07180 [Candidatus Binatia bacterium]